MINLPLIEKKILLCFLDLLLNSFLVSAINSWHVWFSTVKVYKVSLFCVKCLFHDKSFPYLSIFLSCQDSSQKINCFKLMLIVRPLFWIFFRSDNCVLKYVWKQLFSNMIICKCGYSHLVANNNKKKNNSSQSWDKYIFVDNLSTRFICKWNFVSLINRSESNWFLYHSIPIYKSLIHTIFLIVNHVFISSLIWSLMSILLI